MADGDVDPRRPRVFGIGLNKTATTSLHTAFEILGLTSLHWGGPPIRRLVETSLELGEPLLTRLDPRFDAFSDIEALSLHFELLDAQYPGSRFVLTVRPFADWIGSRRRHVETNRARAGSGEYTGDFLDVDEPAWRALWDEHVGRARAYFAGRSDFLEIDLTASPEWHPICVLLGTPVPDVAFPWVNRRPGTADATAAVAATQER